MYEAVYLPSARRDLEEAALYIAVDLAAPDAAYHLPDAVDEAVQGLMDMPYRHALYPLIYALSREVRFVPVMQYNVFYCVDEEHKRVEIQRVLHRRRNVQHATR